MHIIMECSVSVNSNSRSIGMDEQLQNYVHFYHFQPYKYQLCLSEVLKHCAERVRDPQKGISCELASMTHE